MIDGFRTQIASDIVRDGLGVELLDSDARVVAEVFRCDADRTVIVRTFEDIPLHIIEKFLNISRNRLGEFEDGTPMPPMGVSDGV